MQTTGYFFIHSCHYRASVLYNNQKFLLSVSFIFYAKLRFACKILFKNNNQAAKTDGGDGTDWDCGLSDCAVVGC